MKTSRIALSLLLAALMLFAALPCSFAEKDFPAKDGVLLGDVNGDGVVNGNDALALLRYTLGLITTGVDLDAADVNGDGAVTANDALMIMRASLGLVELNNAEYTYRLSMTSAPVNWNPHDWQMSSEAEMLTYLEYPLVDISIADDGVNFAWVWEMATGMEDVTATYADRERWLEPDEDGALPTENVIYRIHLNPLAKWANGTSINAQTYVYSMRQLLDPAAINTRASDFMYGDAAIKNASDYHNNSHVGEPIYSDAVFAAEGPYYINFDVPCYFLGSNSPADYYNWGFVEFFCDEDGNDLYQKYAGLGYVEVTDEVKADLLTISANLGDEDPDVWKQWCFVITGVYEETPWEDVGLIAEDDHTLIYVNENPITEFYMKSMMTSNWIVYEPLYEAGKTESGGYVSTNYGTSAATTMSCGPYKLAGFDPSTGFTLTRSDNWYGWNDGRHEGQYQPTRVVYDIIPSGEDALDAFTRGELDLVSLYGSQADEYRRSENLLSMEESYLRRFVFATDLGCLEALEQEADDGMNKRVLYYDEFRKAISLAINRAEYCADCTPGFKPAFFLLNNLYYYDIENNSESLYRNTKEGRDAVLRLYGIEYGPGTEFADDVEAYASVTGYDPEAARALFQSVYEQATADGNYTAGQKIHIRCAASYSELSDDELLQEEFLNEYVAAAAEGTGFEGKIEFEFLGNFDSRYYAVANGEIEMIIGAWGGAVFYPFSTIRVYCEPDYMGGMSQIHESCGWDPTVETITIPINGVNVTKTIQKWAQAINAGGMYYDHQYIDIRVKILSYIESAILGSYQCIPLASMTDCQLFSKKISYAASDYNIMCGFGGIRLMTFNYNDAEWADYVESQGGFIDYR